MIDPRVANPKMRSATGGSAEGIAEVEEATPAELGIAG